MFLTFQTDTNPVSSLSQGQELEIKVNNLKSTDNKTVTATQKVTALDTTVPTVAKVEQSGKNAYKVFFSEPVKTVPTIKTNGGTVSSSAVLSTDGTYATVTVGADLAAGNVSVEIEGGTDYGNLPIAKTTQSFTYAAVATALTATVKSSTHNSVTIKFDRDVQNLTTAGVLFSNTYKGQNQVLGDAGAGTIDQISASEYKVTFANFFAPGESKVFIDYAAGTVDANKIKDTFGNVLAPTELKVTTVADTAKPTVTNVAYDTTKKVINVDFSESIKNIATATYLVRNSTGTVVASGATQGTVDTKAVINTGALKAGTYTVEIKGLEDKAAVANKSDDYTTTLTVADTTAPTISSAVNIKDTVVRVTFSKNMNEADILNAANYTYDGSALPTGTTGPVKVDARTVDITLPSTTTGITGKNIVVSGTVKDSLGNAIGGFSSVPKAIEGKTTTAIATADIKADSVKAIAVNKLQFTVAKQLSGFTKSAIKVNGDEVDAVQYTNNTDGTATVTLTLAAGKATFDTVATLTGGTDSSKLVLGAGALTNAFGEANAGSISFATFKDGIIAKVNSSETADISGNGQIDRITVTLSEAVKASSVQASDFKVEGYTVKEIISVGTDGKVVLSLLESGSADTGATPKVSLVGELEDTEGNKGFDATNQVTAVDKAAPVIVTVATDIANITTAGAATNKLRVTFSEPVASVAGSEFVLGASGNTLTGTTATVVPLTNDTQWSILLGTLAGTPVAGTNLTFTRTATVDKAGTPNNAVTVTVSADKIVYGVTITP